MNISADEPKGKEPAADKDVDNNPITEAVTEAPLSKTGI